MLYDKPATTIDEQIYLLDGRGMIMNDMELVKRWLLTVGYYRLSAYWLPNEQKPTDGATRSKLFAAGTRFEDIVDIYVFDRKLRLLVMEAIERVEIALRSRWTNRLSLAGGSHVHLDTKAFNSGFDHIALLSALSNRVKQSKELSVDHYAAKYSQPFLPPLWVVTELMTFGELSLWFAATRDPKVKSVIAKDMGLPNREVLEGAVQLLSYIRNICAHHSRLWNRRTVKRVPYIKRFQADLVIETNGAQQQPENYIYNALIVLIHMLKHQSPDTSFAARVKALIETRSAFEQRDMGFPHDWQARPCWIAASTPIDV